MIIVYSLNFVYLLGRCLGQPGVRWRADLMGCSGMSYAPFNLEYFMWPLWRNEGSA
jgi:hypothetical protein